ncbi:hypothetical protein LTR08_006946 [Meristemomyces frigidus]|nr:hypothetical protein LTR08_006946 [Meristemomyces frigidus]
MACEQSMELQGVNANEPCHHDVVEAALLLPSGYSTAQRQSGPSDEASEGYAGTALSDDSPNDAGRVDADGDFDMGVKTHIGSQGTSEDTRQQDDDYPMSFVDEARSLGLCHDYLTEDPFASRCIHSPPETVDGERELADPPGVESLALLAALGALNGANTSEKWDVDKESAGFLASVLALGKDDGSSLDLSDTRVSFRDLQLMEPLLHCDPDLELQQLRRRYQVTISSRGISPFTLDDSKAEGFQWSPGQLGKHAHADDVVASEKLDVSQDVILCLMALASPAPMSYREMLTVLLDSEKAPRARLESPPLMPISPPFSPQALPDELQDIELMSSPEDLMATEAGELDRRIMEVDENAADTRVTSPMMRAAGAKATDLGDLYSGLETPTNSSSSPLKRKTLRNLRAELPLMPAELDEPPTKKAKTIPISEEIYKLVGLPESDVSVLDADFAHQDLDAFIEDVVMPFAEAALEQTENEQLNEIDTTMRVAVPQLESIAPVPPWELYKRTSGVDPGLDAQRALLSFTKRELMKGETAWSGVSKLERALAWSPFPARLGKVKLDEDFDDDVSAARYMAQLDYDEEMDLQGLISKTEGLRLLDACESDDEELEPAEFEEKEELEDDLVPGIRITPTHTLHTAIPREVTKHGIVPQDKRLQAPVMTVQAGRLDMRALLQRRKLELEKESEASKITLGGVSSAPSHVDDARKPRQSGAGLIHSRPSDLFREGGIANYLQLQGTTVAKPASLIERESADMPQMVAPTACMEPVPMPITTPSARENRPLPMPALPAAERVLQTVVPTHILNNRMLVRELHTLLPNLDLVARDSVAKAATDNKQHARQGDSTEADVTMSPRSGLITTTLSNLKQRPLPNQTSFFGIRDRIATVSVRYEKLVVLVSEGRQCIADDTPQAQALEERDCDALSDLMGFAAQLDVDIDVKYVPGGEEELVKWMAAAILQHCVPVNDVKVLQEETLWERFLRVAGMNAFAAQVVLMNLKQPDSVPGSESSSTQHSSQELCYGLPAFVRMSAGQRIQQFGPILGGEGVLTRVGQIIDSGWMSSTRGK